MPTLAEELERLRRQRQMGAEVDQPPGLLARLGQALDYPRSKLWELAGAGPDNSGRDVLEKAGMLGPNQPGFDAGDVAGFALEVAGDPLTYLGGLGALTRGGKAAANLGRARTALKGATVAERAAEASGDLARLGRATTTRRGLAEAALAARREARAAGVPGRLGATWAEQGARRQRQLLGLDIPFGPKAPLPIPGTQLGLSALDRLGGAARAIPGVEAARRVFQSREGRLGAAEPLYELRDQAVRGAEIDLPKEVQAGRGELDEIAKLTGEARPDLEGRLSDVLVTPAGNRVYRTPQEAGLVGKLSDSNARILAAQKAAGQEISSLTDPGLEYSRRLLTPEARAAKATEPYHVRAFRENKVNTGTEIQRVKEFEGKKITEINQEVAQGGGPSKLFVEDPVLATAYRKLEGERSVANANLAKSLVKRFGSTTQAGMPAPEFLKQAGLMADPTSAGKFIPHEIAQTFLDTTRKLSQPHELDGIFKTLGAVRGFYSKLLLPLFPGFHVRNFETNAIMTSLSGVTRSPFEYTAALFKAIKAYRDPATHEAMQRLGVLAGRQGEELTGRSAKAILSEEVFRGAKPPISRLSKLGKPEEYPLLGRGIKLGYKVGDATEGISRITHFLLAKQRGLSDLEAVRSVRKYLFDYGDLSPTESKYIRPLFLFYPFMRKIIPRLFGEALEHPRGISALSRAGAQPTIDRSNVPLPEFVRQSLATPAGTNEAGDPRFITGLGSPLENLLPLDLTNAQGGVLGAARKGFRNLGMLLNPALKIPIELATGHELYSDAPIMDRDKAPIAATLPGLKQLLGTREKQLPSGPRLEADPMALYALAASPFSRLMRSGGQAADVVNPALDPRTSTGQQLLSLLLGLKIATVDPEQQRRAAADTLRDQAQPLIRAGELREYKTLYAPGSKEDRTARAAQLLRELQQLRRRRSAP